MNHQNQFPQIKTGQKRHYEIRGQRLFLRPYAHEFVQRYHQWFVDDPQLLFLTGSEPLTLQEQYQNHSTWITDPLKYTFLIFTNEGEMIGDINLFFSKWIEPNEAEINIMIARRDFRGKGYAKEALLLVEAFAKLYYCRDEIIAKIKDDNTASVKLFQKNGYRFINHNHNFKEVEYRKTLSDPKESYQSLLLEVREINDISSLLCS